MKKIPIEAKGMFIAIIGVSIMALGNTQDTTLFEIIRWLGWLITAIGCIYAMQLTTILKNILKK